MWVCHRYPRQLPQTVTGICVGVSPLSTTTPSNREGYLCGCVTVFHDNSLKPSKGICVGVSPLSTTTPSNRDGYLCGCVTVIYHDTPTHNTRDGYLCMVCHRYPRQLLKPSKGICVVCHRYPRQKPSNRPRVFVVDNVCHRYPRQLPQTVTGICVGVSPLSTTTPSNRPRVFVWCVTVIHNNSLKP